MSAAAAVVRTRGVVEADNDDDEASAAAAVAELRRLRDLAADDTTHADRLRVYERSAEERLRAWHQNVWRFLLLGAVGVAICAAGALLTGGGAVLGVLWTMAAVVVVAFTGARAWRGYEDIRQRDPGIFSQVNPGKLVPVAVTPPLAATAAVDSSSPSSSSGSGGGSGGVGEAGACIGRACCTPPSTIWSPEQNKCVQADVESTRVDIGSPPPPISMSSVGHQLSPAVASFTTSGAAALDPNPVRKTRPAVVVVPSRPTTTTWTSATSAPHDWTAPATAAIRLKNNQRKTWLSEDTASSSSSSSSSDDWKTRGRK